MPQILYETWDDKKVSSILKQLPDYLDVLKWAYKEYGDRIVYSCSFGAEGIVLIDLISKVKQNAKVVFLDTGLHFNETYKLIDQIKCLYPNLQIELIKPNLTLHEQAKKFGNALWETNPNLCCKLRKIDPLEKVLQDYDAWISGLRREQTVSRRNTEYINKDNRFKKIKICPLIHWTWDDVLTYLRLNHLPYNPLHDQGYPSIGCATCTRPVKDNEDWRAGRWAGQRKIECGLHLESESI